MPAPAGARQFLRSSTATAARSRSDRHGTNGDMNMRYVGMCGKCANRDFDAPTPVCAAYPDGIPDEIIRQGFDHRQPYPGDNGIRFIPKGPIDVEWFDNFWT
jgi:hypothetical protein